MRRRKKDDGVYSITSARRALSEDLHDRNIRYLVSMGIRTTCLLLAFVVDGPLRWLMVLGAVVIPYIAVIVANAGREQSGAPDATTQIALPPGTIVLHEGESLR